MPYKKKAPAKRTKKAVGGALSAAQKRMLGQVQKEMVDRGAGAITKEVVGLTRKHGDHRKSATVAAPKRKAPAKRKAPTQKRGGLAMSKAARANLMRMQREAFKTGKNNPKLAALTKKYGMLVKRGDAQKAMKSQKSKTPRIMSTVTGARKARELAAKRRGSSTTRRPAVMPKRGTAAYNQLMARRRAAAAKRRAPSRRRAPTRMTPAQRRARLLAARRRMAAMRRRAPSRRRAPTRRIPTTRRAPTRRPNTRAQNLAARRRAATRRRSRAGVGRRIGAPTSRRGRPSTVTRQRRFSGGMLASIRKVIKKKHSTNPMRAKLTGVKRKAATGSPMINRFKKRGILGKTRTAIGKKRAAGTIVSKSAYKGRGLFGSLKKQAKRTSGFGRMFGKTMRPTSGGIKRVGGKVTMGKAMTAPKRMVKSPVSPRIIKVPKTKLYDAPKGTDPYAKAMNKAMKM